MAGGGRPAGLRTLLVSCTALTAIASLALANPEGGTVVAGRAAIETPAPGRLVVRQESARAVIDWRSFSIGPGEQTEFIQPSAAAIALNRVRGPDPSVIAGRLTANGRIVIQNEAGVTFAEGAQVNAASLLATTSRVDAARLMATGEVAATEPGRIAGARVENRGEITVAEAGVAALVGPAVRNAGRIVAREGRVVLGGAETYTIDLAGDGLIAFAIRDPVARAPADGGAVVANSGTIEAPGGQVVLSARAARGVVDEVIFAGGRIAATAARRDGGAIVLDGGAAGTVTVAGTLDVAGRADGRRGGTVDLRGERIALAATARVDAAGEGGGGVVRIGGNLRGAGPGPTARRVTVASGAAIRADATGRGDGGSVVVWSDEVTRFWGEISARGGPAGGNGGFAEVSSRGWLDYRGIADLRASLGRAGVLLLDPADLRIAAAGAENVTIVGNPPDPVAIAPGPPGEPPAVAVLRTETLQAQLELANVVVSTLGSADLPGQTGRIEIADGFAIPAGRSLTLEAAGEIALAGGAAVGAAGPATLALRSGLAGPGGIQLAGTIDLGAAGTLLLDATGGGTGTGGAIAQTAGSITTGGLSAQAAQGVSITAATATTLAGAAGAAFTLAATGSAAVGTVGGTAGIVTTGGAPVTLAVAGALALDQPLAAPGGTVSLTTGGAITQGPAGRITAARLAIQAGGAVALDAAPNQVAQLAAVSAGGLALRTQANATVAARNGTGGDIALTGQGNLTVGADTVSGLAGVENPAGAVALEAGATLTVNRPVTAATEATLRAAALTVNDAVAAPAVVAITDTLTIGAAGALGTGGLAEAVVRPRTAGRGISLGGSAGGTLSLPAETLARIGPGAGPFHLRLGSLGDPDRPGEAPSGSLTVRGATDLGARRVTLEAGSAGADVTQLAGAPLTAASLIARSAQGSVRLGAAANPVPLLAGAAGPNGDFEFRAAGTLGLDRLAHGSDAAVAGVAAGRSVRLASDAGAVTQSAAGSITAEGLAVFAPADAVELTAAANAVGTLAGTAAAGFRVRVAGDLAVGTVPAGAALPAATGITVTEPAAAATLLAAGDLALAAPVAAGTVRLAAGRDLTQTAAGTITAEALLARAGRDLLLDAADGTRPPGAPGGPGGNQAATVAAAAGRELWYRSGRDVTVGVVAGEPLVDPAVGLAAGGAGAARVAVSTSGGGLTVAAPVAGQGVELAADRLNLLAPVGAEAEAVVVRPVSAGRGIALGTGAGPDTLWLPAEALDRIGGPASVVRVGSVGGPNEAPAGPIVVGDITVNRTADETRSLVLETGSAAAAAIAQMAPISGGGPGARLAAAAPAGGVWLTDVLNLVGTIAGAAGPGGFQLQGTGDITVGATPARSVGALADPLTVAGYQGIATADAPVALLATGGLELTAPVTAGVGPVRLQAGETLGQRATGTIASEALFARGSLVELTAPGNAVATLAGEAFWGFRFRNGGGLTVGTVDGVEGITTFGFGAPVSLRAAGDLTLARPISVGFGPGAVVRLEAAGTLAQAPGGLVIAGGLLARATTVRLEAPNVLGGLAGEAQAEFRAAGFGDLPVVAVPGDTLVAGAAGIRLGEGTGTVALAGGRVFGGGVLVAAPVDAGAGTVRLEAGADGHLRQTAAGPITATAVEAVAPAGGIDLATAGAMNAIGSVSGIGRDGFRLRTASPLTVGTAGIATQDAPLTLVAGGDLTLAGPLAAGSGTVRLRAAGSIAQAGGAITADALAALADGGAVALTAPGNAVGMVAGAAAGPFAVTAAGPLAVVAVGPDGPAETQAGVVDPAARLVPGLPGVASAAAVRLAAGGPLLVSSPVQAGAEAVLAAGGDMLLFGPVQAGAEAVLAAGGDMLVLGRVQAGADALVGAGGAALVLPGGRVQAGPGRMLILGFGTDFLLGGALGAPEGRILIRRAAPAAPGSVGRVALQGGGAQLSAGGAPRLVAIDTSGDLRPPGAPDPGTAVEQLRGTLAALVPQTAEEIAANRIVRLVGLPSLTARVTGGPVQFGTPAAAALQGTVDVALGTIEAPAALLYLFGENGTVTSDSAVGAGLRLRAMGVYVNPSAEVALFGVLNGVAGEAAATFVQRLGDPQPRQRLNGCTIGLIGCRFLPPAQEPAIAAAPPVLIEAAAPRFDESAVPIVNTGPEEELRPAEADEEEAAGAAARG